MRGGRESKAASIGVRERKPGCDVSLNPDSTENHAMGPRAHRLLSQSLSVSPLKCRQIPPLQACGKDHRLQTTGEVFNRSRVNGGENSF